MWHPVRLEDLPLVLCEPILRRVEPATTTFFFALREETKVTVRVYDVVAVTATSDTRRTTRTVCA
ncbi:hypothetical protein SAMN05421678_1295 [Actinopolymorpha cephalotaxi]|uniref:Uncharacterized protein n=1 Tax=Actinopolymorpha cephalotaxi TaxID=504797 RepID=A0A1I3C3W6_9ACTN|nr:hypothetical protein [Actinopolymorpha cephalotaxi]SFH69234.1 hypothetical protein SAMN05421678_1295 [Actinopolymorpha cephalotaxi]